MSKHEPFSKNGDSDGAVPALVCSCCGEPVPADATIDIYQQGATFLARTPRGRAALLLAADGIDEIDTDAARAAQLVQWFDGMGLKCVRQAEPTDAPAASGPAADERVLLRIRYEDEP